MKRNAEGLGDFDERRRGIVRALLRRSVPDELDGLGILDPPGFVASCEFTEYAGRTTPLRARLSSGVSAVVRRYQRAGIARIFLQDRYLGKSRPFGEVVVSEHLRSRGVPTVEILAAVHIDGAWPTHTGFMVSREIIDAVPLRRAVSQAGEDGRGVLLKRVPDVFRCLHGAGVAHHDLTVDNVLVDGNGGVLVVDLDGCRISDEVSISRRLSDLLRFRRSARKNSLGVTGKEWKEFFGNYAAGDEIIVGMEERWLKSFDRRLPFYKLCWKLGI